MENLSPLSEASINELCEELGRRSPEGIYVCMFSPPISEKPNEICAGFYYKAPNIDGIAKIIGHTLMWFLGNRITHPGTKSQPQPPDDTTLETEERP